MSTNAVSQRILVVEDDPELLDMLLGLLNEEGYAAQGVLSLKEALVAVATHIYDLILADLFPAPDQNALQSAVPLLEQAQPTPVGILTAWKINEEEALQQGFAFVRRKPFDLDDLLTTMAAQFNQSPGQEQRQQIQTVEQYFQALETRDLERLADLCTADILYVPPMYSPNSGKYLVRGLADYQRYVQSAYAIFPGYGFDQIRAYGRPNGLAVRYECHWLGPAGTRQELSGSLLISFEGTRISQVGVRLSEERYRTLLNSGGAQCEAGAK
jgi:CheY-like chemotaxis protein